MWIDAEAFDRQNFYQLWFLREIDYEAEQANPGSEDEIVRATIGYRWITNGSWIISSDLKVREYHFKFWNQSASYWILKFPCFGRASEIKKTGSKIRRVDPYFTYFNWNWIGIKFWVKILDKNENFCFYFIFDLVKM